MSNTQSMNEPEMSPKQKRGFAVMSEERRKEYAARGGKRAHELGTAHRFGHLDGKAAGRKGGLATAEVRRAARAATAVSNDGRS